MKKVILWSLAVVFTLVTIYGLLNFDTISKKSGEIDSSLIGKSSVIDDALHPNQEILTEDEVILPKQTESNIYGEKVHTVDTSYVANKNTKKFHYPYCNSVDQMKEKNKQYLTCNRNQVISQGYSPCGNCNP